MTDPMDIQCSSSSHFSTDRRKSCCCSFCDHTAAVTSPVITNEFEPETMPLTPPVENVYLKEESHPFSCIYLLNLFLAPDITRYLAETSISDDVYSLPIHLQRLICEARMEVLVSKQKKHPISTEKNSAVKRLEKVRDYIKSIAHHDIATTIATLTELIRDDDEMSNILE